MTRYHVSAEWTPRADGTWTVGHYSDTGTHVHVFCSEGHELSYWPNELPEPFASALFGAGLIQIGAIADDREAV